MSARRMLAALSLVALLAGACGGDDDDAGTGDSVAAPEPTVASAATPEPEGEVPIEGLVTVDGLSQAHQPGELEFDRFPPVGGEHNPVWQACGHYTVEIPAERAVHSMEHGAVWIAYTPGTELGALEALVADDEHLLMSPVEGLASAIVVSAWGAQVAVDDADDTRIDAFLDRYLRQGPEAAPCVRGGVGVPPDDPGPGLDL